MREKVCGPEKIGGGGGGGGGVAQAERAPRARRAGRKRFCINGSMVRSDPR
jgi:hypothetical protein